PSGPGASAVPAWASSNSSPNASSSPTPSTPASASSSATSPTSSPTTSSTSPTTSSPAARRSTTSNGSATTRPTSTPSAPAAQPIRAPRAAGHILRGFGAADSDDLMDVINDERLLVLGQQPDAFFDRAVIEADGTVVETTGKCKRGMDISYKGQWGYHPLLV